MSHNHNIIRLPLQAVKSRQAQKRQIPFTPVFIVSHLCYKNIFISDANKTKNTKTARVYLMASIKERWLIKRQEIKCKYMFSTKRHVQLNNLRAYNMSVCNRVVKSINLDTNHYRKF